MPWLVEDFNYQISGGIEPGEEASWVLAPAQFGPWGTVQPAADAILTVETVRLDGPDGRALFSTQDFTKNDADRLKDLKAQFADN